MCAEMNISRAKICIRMHFTFCLDICCFPKIIIVELMSFEHIPPHQHPPIKDFFCLSAYAWVTVWLFLNAVCACARACESVCLCVCVQCKCLAAFCCISPVKAPFNWTKTVFHPLTCPYNPFYPLDCPRIIHAVRTHINTHLTNVAHTMKVPTFPKKQVINSGAFVPLSGPLNHMVNQHSLPLPFFFFFF